MRPYVLLKAAMSIDGYIDDATDERLVLSNAEDFDQVDQERARCDAILVGANTIRRDNPRLLVRSEARRANRVRRGLPEHPAKVTVTSGGLDPGAIFFHTGGEKIVYCPGAASEKVRDRVGELATVVAAGDPLDLGLLLDDIAGRGVARLLVEGGTTLHTQFLTQSLADEIQLTVAPFFVGQADAARLVNPSTFPQDAGHRMMLEEVRRTGDIAFLRYLTRARG